MLIRIKFIVKSFFVEKCGFTRYLICNYTRNETIAVSEEVSVELLPCEFYKTVALTQSNLDVINRKRFRSPSNQSNNYYFCIHVNTGTVYNCLICIYYNHKKCTCRKTNTWDTNIFIMILLCEGAQIDMFNGNFKTD